MKEFLLILLISFVFFGFLRRFLYFQAFQSFTKAAQDMHRREQQQRKPEGTITIDTNVPQKKVSQHDEGEYVDYEEVK